MIWVPGTCIFEISDSLRLLGQFTVRFNTGTITSLEIWINSSSGQVSNITSNRVRRVFKLSMPPLLRERLREPSSTFHENRLYQEVILRQKLGKIGLTHRYRYEQRWIEEQDFRTRFRYFLAFNIPLNKTELSEMDSFYVQIYDGIFINGEKVNESVQYFDRNRLYMGLGYRTSKNLALQFGLTEQTGNNFSKTQLQFGAYHQLFSK